MAETAVVEQPTAPEVKNDKDDVPQYKLEDLYDSNQEQGLIDRFLDVAFTPHDKTWSKFKTKNDKILVDYKYLPNDSLCTIRGETIIEDCTIDDYYRFAEGGYKDMYQWEKDCDKMCTENTCEACIDLDHDIVYGSYNSGVFVISPRDFCYVRARHKKIGYKAKDGKKYDIVCTLSYSIEKEHPFYRKVKKKHVRSILKYAGYIFIRDESVPNHCRVLYVVYFDPCGWIPNWVANLVAPEQGLVIKVVAEKWKDVLQCLKLRKENGFKKDYEPMFNVCGYNDDGGDKGGNNDNDDDEKKDDGGDDGDQVKAEELVSDDKVVNNDNQTKEEVQVEPEVEKEVDDVPKEAVESNEVNDSNKDVTDEN